MPNAKERRTHKKDLWQNCVDTAFTRPHPKKRKQGHRYHGREHQDHIQPSGVSPNYWALVHEQVPPKLVSSIPEAAQAVDDEWKKLEDKGAWDIAEMIPKEQAIAQCKARGVKAHFGALMQLCHKKHAEQDQKYWKYKGRVVYRGDGTKDEEGKVAKPKQVSKLDTNLDKDNKVKEIERSPKGKN